MTNKEINDKQSMAATHACNGDYEDAYYVIADLLEEILIDIEDRNRERAGDAWEAGTYD